MTTYQPATPHTVSLQHSVTSSVVPPFGDSAFDAEATQAMANAYDIACRSLHPKGRLPVIQELLAKKIVQAAQRGEGDPERLAVIALGNLGPFYSDITRRFGLVPNFFMSAPDAPEIVERLWDFAKSAYLDNPMPSLFKERLFVFLSRFCLVRYCIVRHCGFLAGYGHSSGDASARPQNIEQVLRLLRVLPPWRRELEPIYKRLAALNALTDWPDPESEIEDCVFAAAALIFVEPGKSERARDVLRQALGGKRLEFLLALLAFIRAAHFWTVTHPGLEIEDDMRKLMSEEKELASMLLQDPVLPVAEEANRAKSAFLAAVSHDLRQPLQAMKILQGTLAQQIHDSAARKSIVSIGRSLDTMTDMLTSLLDINQLEAGALRPSASVFSVSDILDDLAADFFEHAKEKGLRWRLVRSRIAVHSDRRMLKEMIRNLVSNAIRYTDRGSILVGCRRAGDKVRIEVWDSGVGIMAEHMPRIFEEHYQGPQSAELGGFGLGLAIVQRLGNILGHQISARSTSGKGSVFSIEVPLGREQAKAGVQTELPMGRSDAPVSGTILIIEDETSVRNALERWLRSQGLRAVSVANGNEALALITEKGMRPDLILSDYNIPGPLNGIESVHALREALTWKIPAIILTGDTRSRVVGAIAKHDVAIAIKPVKGDQLKELVVTLLGGSKAI
jgi:signal transduction histidine kinase/CheY-like chemotaxis protein